MILIVLSDSVPQWGGTALMEASGSGHTNVVQLLLSSGAQMDLQDEVRHNIKLLVTSFLQSVSSLLLSVMVPSYTNQKFAMHVST